MNGTGHRDGADEAPPLRSPRRRSPAAERNGAPILAELQRLLPARGNALEIASGSGQHAAQFAAALPGWTWQPSEADADALPSIAAWCAGLPNVRPPFVRDVLDEPWTGAPERVDLVFCANLLHISPWATCGALMRGAASCLAEGGVLLLYGPFVVDGVETASSNVAFDEDLRRRDPGWGVRRLAEVAREADAVGLRLHERTVMPAHNLVVTFRRHPPTGRD